MDNQKIFESKIEIERLNVQNELLSIYESPIIEKLLAKKDSLSVLDIGSNDGSKTVKRFSSNRIKHVVGLEYNSDLVALANKRYKNDKYSFYQADVDDDSFSLRLEEIKQKESIKSFDLIYLSFVLMHLKDAKLLLKRLYQSLSPGGVLLIIEAYDKASYISNDDEGLLNKYLEVLDYDTYSGDRSLGDKLDEILSSLDYQDIITHHRVVTSKDKSALFTTFFSYVFDDYKKIVEESDDKKSVEYHKWLNDNYDKLKSLVLDENNIVDMGVKILSCSKKRENSLSFESLTEDALPIALSLVDECVGKNMYKVDELRGSIASSNKYFYLVKNDKAEVVGYIYFKREEQIPIYLSIYPLLKINNNNLLGKIQSIGVKSCYRGSHYAKMMVEFALKQLKALDSEMVYLVCWKTNGFVPLKPILLEKEFKYLADLEKPWFDKEDLICPVCKGRCTCDAEIYYKFI